MDHTNLVDIIWGTLGALVIVACTTVRIFEIRARNARRDEQSKKPAA